MWQSHLGSKLWNRMTGSLILVDSFNSMKTRWHTFSFILTFSFIALKRAVVYL